MILMLKNNLTIINSYYIIHIYTNTYIYLVQTGSSEHSDKQESLDLTVQQVMRDLRVKEICMVHPSMFNSVALNVL